MLATVERFGTTTITLYNGVDDLPAGPGYATQADLPAGGARDLFGSGWGRTGARLVRKSGELIADSTAALETAADALRGLAQQRDTLYIRTDSGALRLATARCTRVVAPRAAENTLFLPVALEWIVLDPYFRGEHHGGGWHLDGITFDTPPATVYLDTGRHFDEATGDSFTLASAPSPTTGNIFNNGNTPIYDPIIKITAGATAITFVRVKGWNCEWTWTGTLAAGKQLIMDAGALTITNDGADAYSGLAFTSNHFIPDWFQMIPGLPGIEVEVTTVSTDATVGFFYDDGYM
jgi:hypothetical protein